MLPVAEQFAEFGIAQLDRGLRLAGFRGRGPSGGRTVLSQNLAEERLDALIAVRDAIEQRAVMLVEDGVEERGGISIMGRAHGRGWRTPRLVNTATIVSKGETGFRRKPLAAAHGTAAAGRAGGQPPIAILVLDETGIFKGYTGGLPIRSDRAELRACAECAARLAWSGAWASGGGPSTTTAALVYAESSEKGSRIRRRHIADAACAPYAVRLVEAFDGQRHAAGRGARH
jgi:hypothetical protein